MKLNQLFHRSAIVIAVLAIGVWGLWKQELLTAGSQEKDKANQNGLENESERKQGTSVENSKDVEADSQDSNQENLDLQKNNEKVRELLQESILLLRNRSFRTSLRQRGQLFGTELIASGTYLHADGGKGGVRTELEIQTSHLNLQVEMVNDGVYYFRRVKPLSDSSQPVSNEKKIDTNARPAVERINLREIREKLGAEDGWPGHWISYGGLYLFMDQARRSFEFGPIQTKKIKGVEYDVISGTWKPEKLASLVPAQKESILERHAINWKRIPRQIPLEIEIVFFKQGELKAFPYRVIFYRPNEELLDGVRSYPVLITEYTEPVFIETPPQSDFQFNADENEVVDITDEFLSSLRQ